MKLFSSLLLIITTSVMLNAQNKPETVIIGDTVILNVTSYNGTLQWEISTDSITWTNVPGAVNATDTVTEPFSASGMVFYRAAVTDSLCPNSTPFYSSVICHEVVSSVNDVAAGDWHKGGVVFHNDGMGDCLIAPLTDQGGGIYGHEGELIPGAYSTTDGKANTDSILLMYNEPIIAAYSCRHNDMYGFADWFLPAKDQLNYLYQNIGYFGTFYILTDYWTSTQIDELHAYAQDMFTGSVSTLHSKQSYIAVRCVRSSLNTAYPNRNYSYSVVTDQFETATILLQPSSFNKCAGESCQFSVSAQGTSISYQWKKDGNIIPGAIDSLFEITDISFSDEGIYTCDVTNMCRTVTSDNAVLNVINLNLEAGDVNQICKGQEVILPAVCYSNHPAQSVAIQYSWSPQTGLSSDDVLNPVASPEYTTAFVISASDSLGCVFTDTIIVPVKVPFPDEQVCLVTVDTSTWKNKVIWNKTAGQGTVSFNIYKEATTNNYSLIGNSDFSQPCEFIDSSSVPEVHGNKYKITVVDTCGNESDIDDCYYHKTVNLTIWSSGSTIGLTWDDYIDESGDYVPFRYYIYKGTNPSQMTILDSVSGSFNSYNDINVQSLNYYMVGSKRSGCGSKSELWLFSNKRDNSDFIGSAGFVHGNVLNVNVKPNPFLNDAVIEINGLTCYGQEKISLSVTDISGKIIRKEDIPFAAISNTGKPEQRVKILFERNGLDPGIYFIEIKADKVYRTRIIAE